ncbi:hypothetical protein ACEWY4_025210 [Coilia grayii]|uniref:C-type lectin domain-containing protein n=1 Tax=Coilia grayii TaxID=363190 RepID=A0ABD1IWX5_9TELE
MDSVEEMSYGDQADENATSKILNMIGTARNNKQGLYRLATVCLGLLCIILLMVIVSHHSHSRTPDATDGRFQPQTYDNLSHEIDQLQSSYSNLNRQMALLITSHNILIEEKSLLLARYHNLTDHKQHIETSYNNLMLENSQLEDKYNNLGREKEQLQTSYNNLNRANTILTDEIAELQNRYNNLTKDRDDLLKKNTKLDSRMGWVYRKPRLYKISTEKKNWHESRGSCLKLGADLVVVNDIDEQTFLLPYKTFWIGLSDTEEEGVWKWVDGTPQTESFWRPGEPNNAGNEDCAEISTESSKPTQAWNDVPCSQTHQYICEDHI